ncbi:hydrolase [Streptomyces sp. SA15]|uniref:isochorismatase family protein n=1 Tax=Streptomyces sp. SA15 TaxID=934019 RepID=UPI000BAF0899|nr:isochorismatase family protein [Streptomyces sp. SA15]PAZ16349.1 hydrolase [Streptomyces sp. SA15]
MTLSTVDAKPALVVIDLQKGILAMPGGDDGLKQVIQHAAELAAAFRSRGLPVALVSILGDAPGRTDVSGPADFTPQPDFADPVDELAPQQGDIRVLRQRWSAFGGTTLHDDLQQAGVTQVVLAGVATSIGVESSARTAHEHGYNVVLATDAMTDMNPGAHHNSIHNIFPRLGETATTTEILAKLQHTR